ncbi:Hermansky-Pudlak syndrome 1 protein isoform X2 [Anoplophora glabripennis]|uniref:Hermansky-Pudlak syndrome 1 protein isoform X2 n=1 Tax=Anoplophora glabripennis TaxID=217634 RepID=UPI000873DDC8|nr:Hermansky-Pudlak syndrome 1 protein isoform X2 [Anoplophora glabripennis]
MNGLLIFDHLNDIVYTKFNKAFAKHINDFATNQGLIAEGSLDSTIENDVIVQIFSPIITSHRIMNCQFGNSYTSIQCGDSLKLYFNEYMGYLFVVIGDEGHIHMKKYISICVTIVRCLCGPDVYQLKAREDRSDLTSKLIDSWSYLNENDQAIFVEAVEQLIVNADLSSETIKSLRDTVDKLTPLIECNRVHALVLVQNRFLSLYSSQNAKELSSADTLFLIILCQSINLQKTEQKETVTGISSYQVLLAGPDRYPKCLPHVVHVVPISEGVNLLYLLEIGNPAVAASLYENFCHLHTMQLVQIQRDRETLQPAFENLDLATRRLNDSLKKNKNSAIENSYKQLMKKWEVIRKKYQEYLKNASDEALLRAETLALGFLENLKELLSLTSVDGSILQASRKHVVEAARIVKDKLDTFDEFLKVKSIKNFSLGSYLEEFPGLVHFLYIDRTTHRVTTPTLDLSTEESLFTKKKIWFMMNFARLHLQEGNLSLMWKDTTFNYTYFLWFEDTSGAPLKPSVFPTANLPLPGILCEDFYMKLKEICFPKMASAKVRCYELFCMHLGLVTASCVLEQTRRLSATIWELRGHPSHAIDLL